MSNLIKITDPSGNVKVINVKEDIELAVKDGDSITVNEIIDNLKVELVNDASDVKIEFSDGSDVTFHELAKFIDENTIYNDMNQAGAIIEDLQTNLKILDENGGYFYIDESSDLIWLINQTDAAASGDEPENDYGVTTFGDINSTNETRDFREELEHERRGFETRVFEEDTTSDDITTEDILASAPSLQITVGDVNIISAPNATLDFNLNKENSNVSYAFSSDTNSIDITIKSYKASVDDGKVILKKDGVVVEEVDLDVAIAGINNAECTITLNSVSVFNSIEIISEDNSQFKIIDVSDDSIDTVTSSVTQYEYPLNLTATLTDTDGSESLSDILVTNLPDDVSIKASEDVIDNGDGTYSVDITSGVTSTVTLISSDSLTPSELNVITVSVTSTESSSDDTATVTTDPIQTATLVDGIVEGVEYSTTSGLSGLTDENGNFSFKTGDVITFNIGGVILGVATAEDVITGKTFLQDLANVDRSNLNDEYVENMATFLQSLDENSDAYDGIVITSEIRDSLTNENIDLRSASQEDVENLINNLGATYVDEEAAMEHVKDMLVEHSELDEGDFEEHVKDEETETDNINAVVTDSLSESDDILFFDEFSSEVTELNNDLAKKLENIDISDVLVEFTEEENEIIEIIEKSRFSETDNEDNRHIDIKTDKQNEHNDETFDVWVDHDITVDIEEEHIDIDV